MLSSPIRPAYADTRVLMLTHQRELISQNFQALLRAWPEAPAGIYSAGLSRRDIRAQILFAGIQSIHRHAFQVQRCDLVLIDEAHLLGRGDSGMYRSFLAQLNEINAGLLKVVGFTATPYRLDSGLLHEGKDRLFTDIAYEVPVLEMIQQGYLSPVIPKLTTTQLDVGGVGTRGGEFIAKDLEAAVDRDEVTQAAVAEIVQHGEGRGSWLVFCSGVAHARHVRDAIREHGISAETVTGDTPAPERDGDMIGALDAPMEALRTLLAGKPARAPRDPGAPRKPREGTKQELVLAMLRRAEGATVAQIADATGWAQHTVRGFFAGLKKKGHAVEVRDRIRQVGPNKTGAKGSFTIYALAE
jgi:hypothetical protein